MLRGMRAASSPSRGTQCNDRGRRLTPVKERASGASKALAQPVSSEREGTPLALDALERTGLLAKANRLAGALPLLDRKRLELARALATRPDLLLLDEIAGGLTEHEAHELVDELKRIKQSGMTMIWIEHVVHALLSVADRLLVINFGKTLCEGHPEAVMQDAEVRRVYMGLEA